MKYIIFIIILLTINCYPTKINKNYNQDSTKAITSIDQALTHKDSCYVIDYHYRNENGNIKPPCSSSPAYCKCMKARGIIPNSCK